MVWDTVNNTRVDLETTAYATLSPDGKTMLMSYRDRWEFWSVKDKKLVKTVQKEAFTAMYTASGMIMAADREGMYLYDPATGESHHHSPMKPWPMLGWSISDDGKTIFLRSDKTGVWDLQAAKPVLLAGDVFESGRGWESGRSMALWNKDGVAFMENGRELWQWKPGEAKATLIRKHLDHKLLSGWISGPDGIEVLALESGLVRIMDLDGKTLESWMTHPVRKFVYSRGLSPDHRMLGFTDLLGIDLWSVASGQLLHTVKAVDAVNDPRRPPPMAAIALAFSPDSKFVATGYSSIGIYDLLSGSDSPAAVITPPGGYTFLDGFSPDGRLIVAVAQAQPGLCYGHGLGRHGRHVLGFARVLFPERRQACRPGRSGRRDRNLEAASPCGAGVKAGQGRHRGVVEEACIRRSGAGVRGEQRACLGRDRRGCLPAARSGPGTKGPELDLDDLIRKLDDDNSKVRDRPAQIERGRGERDAAGQIEQGVRGHEIPGSQGASDRSAQEGRAPGAGGERGLVGLARGSRAGDDRRRKGAGALESIADGGADKWQTLDAKSALERLKARNE